MQNQVFKKTTLGILRDCLKVVPHMTQSTNPAVLKNVRSNIMNEFRKNKDLVDEKEIEQKRMVAIKGISNYYVHLVKDLYQQEKKYEDEIIQKRTEEAKQE